MSKYGWGDEKPAAKKKSTGDLGLTGRVIHRSSKELRDFVSAVPYLPRVVTEQLARGAALGGQQGAGETIAKFAAKLPGAPGTEKKPIAVGTIAEGEKVREAFRQGKGEGLQAVADLPGINLLPGAYVGSRLLTKEGRTELGQRPLSSVLDVLPYVGKAGKVATRGGKLASEAAKVAEQGGRAVKAERMVREGLKLPEIAVAVGRRGEKAIVGKAPTLDRVMPSQLLARAQAGGSQLRNFMRVTAGQDRRFAEAATRDIEEIASRGQQFGIAPERQLEVTRIAESGAPDWKTKVARHELDWLDDLNETLERRVTDPGVEAGKLVRGFDDVWSTTAAGEKKVASAIRSVETATANAAKASVSASNRFGGKTSQEWAQAAQEGEQAARILADKTPSARWKRALQPFIEEELKKVSASLTSDPAKWEEIYGNLFNAGLKTQIPGLDTKTVGRIARETAKKLGELKAAGYDPMYVPTLRPDDIAALANPRLTAQTIKTPDAWKARGLDQKDLHVPQAAIAVTRATVDVLERGHAQEAFAELQKKGFLLDRQALESLPQVQALAKKGWNKIQVEAYIDKRWRSYSPDSPFPFGRAGVSPRSEATVYLPRPLADAMDSMTKGGGGLLGGLGRVTGGKAGSLSGKIFRASILTTSPFYYLENLVSGAVMLMARQSPASLAYLPQALKMIRADKVPLGLTRGARQGVADVALAAYHTKAGGTLGRLLDEGSGLQRAGQIAGAPLRWGEKLAQTIDDMYRTAAYLKASKKGLDVERGIEGAIKVFGDFDVMTPLEKAVIKTALAPFYGWSRFILGYVFSFPFDHPLRAAVMGAVAREAFDDWPEGLPERLKGYLFYGTPDENGNRMAVSMAGAIPMLGVANYFTFAGVLQRLGPQYSAFLQESGVNEYGEIDLYPELRWDPVTGRETIRRPNVAGLLGKGYVQQAETLQMLFAETADMARLRESNPEAYRAKLLSTVGVKMPRTINVQKELVKSGKAQGRVAVSQAREEKPAAKVSAGSGDGSKYGW